MHCGSYYTIEPTRSTTFSLVFLPRERERVTPWLLFSYAAACCLRLAPEGEHPLERQADLTRMTIDSPQPTSLLIFLFLLSMIGLHSRALGAFVSHEDPEEGVLGLKRVGNGVDNESMKERRGYFRRVEESINRDVTINEIWRFQKYVHNCIFTLTFEYFPYRWGKKFPSMIFFARFITLSTKRST